MSQLIPVAPHTVGSETIPTVNARELHTFLESKAEFRHWIKDRIEQFDFAEGSDFVTVEKIIRGGKAVSNIRQ